MRSSFLLVCVVCVLNTAVKVLLFVLLGAIITSSVSFVPCGTRIPGLFSEGI